MYTLRSTLIYWSVSPWRLALFAVLTLVSLQGLQRIGRQIEAQIGFPPFDLQTPLFLEAVLTQLPSYTDAARQSYAMFIAVDTVFPIFASVFLALLFAKSLSVFAALREKPSQDSWLVLLPLSGMVLDWLENVFFALTVWSGQPDPLWASAAVGVKGVKVVLSIALISAPIVLFSVGVGVARVFVALRRPRAERG